MKAFVRCLALCALAFPLFAQLPAPVPAKPRVRLTTSYGVMVLELEPSAAPRTVENFLMYVKKGHYAGTIFHRVIPGFMIQGGGMTEDLAEKPTAAPVKNEAPLSFRAGLKNAKGTVAMARTSDPDSAAAQFFINTADNASLDFKDESADGIGYCVFGRVIEGMDVALKIEQVKTGWKKGQANVPDYPVRIKSAEVLDAK
ncbi:MAG: peptidyl-prolyl cis-trans isomerase [Acidobacteriota bacterium]|nr:peptidyl-prolyl cis-trans isomerase [Acidobacteriota bacterium]